MPPRLGFSSFYRPGDDESFELFFCLGGLGFAHQKIVQGFCMGGGGWPGLELTDTFLGLPWKRCK